MIRTATAEDLAAVLLLHRTLELYQPFPWSSPKWVQQRIQDGNCFVYSNPSSAVLCMSEDGDQIDSLVVASQEQKKGIGRILVSHATMIARQRNASKLLVESYCAYNAEKFYESCGFCIESKEEGILPYWKLSMQLR
jgi:GNAT superfamily N-acetyltransferase